MHVIDSMVRDVRASLGAIVGEVQMVWGSVSLGLVNGIWSHQCGNIIAIDIDLNRTVRILK